MFTELLSKVDGIQMQNFKVLFFLYLSHLKFLFEKEWGYNEIKSMNLLNVPFIHQSRFWKDPG